MGPHRRRVQRCAGHPTAGAVTVTLTAATPDVTCSFTNTYTATVAPVAPVSPIAPIVVHPTG